MIKFISDFSGYELIRIDNLKYRFYIKNVSKKVWVMIEIYDLDKIVYLKECNSLESAQVYMNNILMLVLKKFIKNIVF